MGEPFYDTIVVGADFSDKSRDVFRRAVSMAKAWRAKVVLAHIASLPQYEGYVMGEMPAVELPTTSDEVEALKEKLQSYYQVQPQDEIEVEVLHGDPATDLVELARNYPNPLIAVGHTEKGVFGRWALGSVSQDLAVKSSVPVWIQ